MQALRKCRAKAPSCRLHRATSEYPWETTKIPATLKHPAPHSQFDLPVPQAKSATSDTESLKDFWTVADMFTFENVGFSHTVDNVKFLVCADCELGPIGYHDIPTKKSFIALDRVRHV